MTVTNAVGSAPRPAAWVRTRGASTSNTVRTRLRPRRARLAQEPGQLDDVVGAHQIDEGHAFAQALALLLRHAARDHEQDRGRGASP
jgi:hypothetical protein